MGYDKATIKFAENIRQLKILASCSVRDKCFYLVKFQAWPVILKVVELHLCSLEFKEDNDTKEQALSKCF